MHLMSHDVSILCLACDHPLDTAASGRCASCRRPFDPIDVRSVNGSGHPLGTWARWCLRAHPWPAVAGVVLMIVCLSSFALWENLPMRIALLASTPDMDQLADTALADPANAGKLAGRWAGVYRIDGVQVIGKTVVLYVGKDRGDYGFARVPN